MNKEIKARRNEGKHLKTLYMLKNKFIIKSVDFSIMMGVDKPDIFVSLVESGHTYDIYVKYTNIVTQETYEKSCDFVVGFMPDTNLCYEVYVTDTGVEINTEKAPGTADVLRIHARGEKPELCAVIELIDVSNICKDLESKNDTKTETDDYAFAKSDNTEIPSTHVFTAPYNKTPDDPTKLFITFLKDRLRDQHFSKLNDKIDKADNEDDLKEDIEAMLIDVSRLIDTANSITNRNKTLQRDLNDLLQYPEYKELAEVGPLLTEYITMIDDNSKHLKVILDLLHSKIKK